MNYSPDNTSQIPIPLNKTPNNKTQKKEGEGEKKQPWPFSAKRVEDSIPWYNCYGEFEWHGWDLLPLLPGFKKLGSNFSVIRPFPCVIFNKLWINLVLCEGAVRIPALLLAWPPR